jgi:ubiquinone/menaquinone biosynthesis C-methylase UbiE
MEQGEQINIELGCGTTKQEGKVGIDRLPLKGVDIVHDVENGLGFLPDNSVDEISSSHFLEHINNFEELMREIHRVLKPNGLHIAIVPHFSNPYYYSDYTHKRFFGLYTFDYLATQNSCLKRKVPDFYTDFKFEIISRKYNFNSPFKIRHALKQVPKKILGINNYLKEFYEETLCWIFPCSTITYIMRPAK